MVNSGGQVFSCLVACSGDQICGVSAPNPADLAQQQILPKPVTHGLFACPVFLHWAAASLPPAPLDPDSSVASLIREMSLPETRAMQHAVFCDAALWAMDRLRHGSCEHPLALMRARLKELVLRHLACRIAVPLS